MNDSNDLKDRLTQLLTHLSQSTEDIPAEDLARLEKLLNRLPQGNTQALALNTVAGITDELEHALALIQRDAPNFIQIRQKFQQLSKFEGLGELASAQLHQALQDLNWPALLPTEAIEGEKIILTLPLSNDKVSIAPDTGDKFYMYHPDLINRGTFETKLDSGQDYIEHLVRVGFNTLGIKRHEYKLGLLIANLRATLTLPLEIKPNPLVPELYEEVMRSEEEMGVAHRLMGDVRILMIHQPKSIDSIFRIVDSENNEYRFQHFSPKHSLLICTVDADSPFVKLRLKRGFHGPYTDITVDFELT